MTPKEVQIRLDACGPDPTDQERLEITIEHWEVLEKRFIDGKGLPGQNSSGVVSCALCMKYFAAGCSSQETCLLGRKGCFPYTEKAENAKNVGDKIAFTKAANEVVEFLRTFREKT